MLLLVCVLCVFACTRVSVGACMCSSDGERPFMLLSCLHSGAAAEINIVRGGISCVAVKKLPQKRETDRLLYVQRTSTHNVQTDVTRIQSNLENNSAIQLFWLHTV